MMGFFCGLALGSLIGLICLCIYSINQDENQEDEDRRDDR